MKRCDWCIGHKIYEKYHDEEWGKPIYQSDKLFMQFSLEVFQAGLSWLTILRKRADFMVAFDYFNPQIIAQYDQRKVQALLNNPKIIRHKGKIEATIDNAKTYLKLEETQTFSDFLWAYMRYKPIIGQYNHVDQLPTRTNLSEKIARDLKKVGFKFCGPVMVYAFMQAVGMLNNHIITCFKYQENQ